MSYPPLSVRSSVAALSAVAVVSLVSLGCSKSEAATSKDNNRAPAAPQQSNGGALAAPKAETENYSVELKPSGTYAKGQDAVAELVIVTKGDYHINDQYPYRFTPKDGDGVTYKGTVNRDGGQFEKTRAVMKIPFTPTQSGTVNVAGKISLSVCSDKNCLMEKQDLQLPVAVN